MNSDRTDNPLVLGKTIEFPAFRPRLPWLGGDLQTIRNTLLYRQPDFARVPAERLRLPLNDGSGDELWALYNRPTLAPESKPLVVLIHGLTGGEESRNIMTSAAYHLDRGFPVLRLNLRGAGPSLGLCTKHYYAGCSADLKAAIKALPAGMKARGLLLVGVSLGGSILLKFLAENPGHGDVLAAASVCAPIDLQAAQLRIMSRRNSVYHRHLLRGLLASVRRAHVRQRMRWLAELPRVHSVYDFDDVIVAPSNGFESADDYYRRCSVAPMLGRIAAPTLLVHACSDPWVPTEAYLARDWAADGPLTLALTPDGGHVGFHAADHAVPWHDRAIGLFFERAVGLAAQPRSDARMFYFAGGTRRHSGKDHMIE